MDEHAAPARGRTRLTRRKVLDAALRLVDSDGADADADALTMRRFGQPLDCDPMALYRQAGNRAALLDAARYAARALPRRDTEADRLPSDEFPHVRSLVDALLAGYDGEAELDLGLGLGLDILLDILLDGLRAERSTAQRRVRG